MFKVFKENRYQKNKDVYFKLVQEEAGILLEACNEDGDKLKRGTILEITTNGEICICHNISKEIGIKFDDSGKPCFGMDGFPLFGHR